MNKEIICFLAHLSLIANVACSGDASVNTLVTFNAGMTPSNYVPYYEGRKTIFLEQVQKLDADFLCLQEVWLDEDIEAVIKAAKDVYPYSFRSTKPESTTNDQSIPCEEESATQLMTCSKAACAEVSKEDAVSCVVGFCGTELGKTGDLCSQCMLSAVPIAMGLADDTSGMLDNIYDTCTKPGGASEFLYRGNDGLLLLSKVELRNTGVLSYPSFFIKRNALHALVVTAVGDTDIYCTHLTAKFGDELVYAGTSTSWEEENANQISLLISEADAVAGSGRPALVMGDINSGPDIATFDITGYVSDNFKKFEDADWTSFNHEKITSECSLCADNTVRKAMGATESKSIDHMFMLNIDAEASNATIKRAFDSTHETQLANGTVALHHISDHYGFELTLP